MEKCSYFWLNYIVECSTLSISANNGKVFVFLVKLYRGVFHPINFSLLVNFSSLWGWEGNWSPTGCLLVTLLYFMCVGTGHVAWRIAAYCVWELVTLPDVLPFFCRLRVWVAIVCLLPSRCPWMFIIATARMHPTIQWGTLGGRLWPGWLNIISWLWPTKGWHLWPTMD